MTAPVGDWAEHAACQGTPTEWWFPTGEREDLVPAQAAERCRSCPVRTECHRHALLHEHHGVWAGTSPAERQKLRRTLRIRIDDNLRRDTVVDERIVRLYRGDMPVTEIAHELGVTPRTVHRVLVENGTPPPQP